MQSPKRHDTFLSRQRLFSKTDIVTEEKRVLINRLKKHHYKIESKDKSILAKKSFFSLGPYVNHIGLIIILIATILILIPFF